MKDKLIDKYKELVELLKRDKSYLFNNKPTINKIEQLESEIAELEKQDEEQETKVKHEWKNPNCAIDALEFNCGYGNPCICCTNYVPYVEP
jgi:hypothetical protein